MKNTDNNMLQLAVLVALAVLIFNGTWDRHPLMVIVAVWAICFAGAWWESRDDKPVPPSPEFLEMLRRSELRNDGIMSARERQ